MGGGNSKPKQKNEVTQEERGPPGKEAVQKSTDSENDAPVAAQPRGEGDAEETRPQARSEKDADSVQEIQGGGEAGQADEVKEITQAKTPTPPSSAKARREPDAVTAISDKDDEEPEKPLGVKPQPDKPEKPDAARSRVDSKPKADSDPEDETPQPPPKKEKQKKRKLLNGPNIEFLYPSGSKYVGGFKDGKLHGYGKYTYYPSGDEYEGEWWNDMKHGHGSYTYESGDKYVGEWRYGKKHGKGNYTFASGDEYVGSWKADRIHGYGVFVIVRNGNRYEGEWEDSYRHGYGVLISGNGDRYEGHWVRGKEEGHGVLSYVNGNHYCGEWKLGQMDGKGVLIDKAGERHLVEHISGYMISNIPADGIPDPEWAAVWQLADMHQKKLSTQRTAPQDTTTTTSELAKLKLEKEILEKKYNDMLTAKTPLDKEGSDEDDAADEKEPQDEKTQEKLSQLTQQVQLDARRIKEYQSREESTKVSIQELEFTKQKLSEKETEIESLRGELSNLRGTEAGQTEGVPTAKYEALQQELARAKERLGAAQGVDLLELQAKLELAETAASQLDAVAAERDDLQSKYKTINEREKDWKEREGDLLKEIKDLKDKVQLSSERLEATQAAHMEEVDSAANVMQQQIDEKDTRLKEIEEKYKKQKKKLKETETKVKNQEELLQQKEGESAELAKLRQEVTSLRDASEQLNARDAEIAELKLTVGNLSTIATEAAELKDKMAGAVRKAAEMEDQYKQEKHKARKLFNTIEDMKGKIRVYARTRPFLQTEVARKDRKVLQFPDEMSIVVSDEKMKEKKEFVYDTTFNDTASQEEVFEDCKHLVQSSIDGFNVCIFAYGQTGSGKTFTLAGTPDKPGVAPRAMAELWSQLTSISGAYDYNVSCYMVELYNDKLYDLFRDPTLEPVKLEIKKDSRGTVMVNGTTCQAVGNLEELTQYYESGQSNRKTRATKMNDLSSRSHLVFSMIVESTNKETKQLSIGKLSIVDLAGSERLAKTGVEDPTAVAEAQSINLSLTALGNVISALCSGKGHIPYRDNKLTMLMSDSLGGNAKTLMFVNISPASYNTEETLNSLAYASRVKLIKNSPAKAIETSEIKRLKAAIEKLKQGIAVDIDQQEIENTYISEEGGAAAAASPPNDRDRPGRQSLSAGQKRASRTPSPLPGKT